jgi:hemin uptake protein HemP
MRYAGDRPLDPALGDASAGAHDGAGGLARRVDSTAIFAGDREVVITHRGQEYRLRITKADKLLLTK